MWRGPSLQLCILAFILGLLTCGGTARAAELLLGEGSLRDGQSITSKNGRYRAVLQGSDGNFVVYDSGSGKAVWATNVSAGAEAYVIMQRDGNLVVYDRSGRARWASDTDEAVPGKYFLRLEDDGLLTVQRGTPAAAEGVLWSSRQGRRYKIARDVDIARTFRPIFKLSKNTRCFPLAFSEALNTKEQCNHSYDSRFALFAHVTRAGSSQGDSDGNSFRITYGVAFGWQEGTFTGAAQEVISQFEDAGNHGEDAQYLVVDVVDGAVTSVWADLHAGYYARATGGLTMRGNRVVAWVGKYYHPLKLITEHSSVCKSEAEGGYGLSDNVENEILRFTCAGTCGSSRRCGATDTVLNWGDLVLNSPERGGLENDPVVRVELCSVTYEKKRRVGRIKLKSYHGTTVQGGEGTDDCQTIAPYGKMLYGFYGRAGNEVDVLGTIWGDLPKRRDLPPKETSW